MTDPNTSANTLNLIGGWLCLDFINTISWREGDQPHDWLQGYPDLVAWSQHVNILTASQAQHLVEAAKQTPNAADAVYDRAITLRETLYNIFSAITRHSTPALKDISALNEELWEALARLRLQQTGDTFILGYQSAENVLDRMLWDITRSAVDLLTSNKLDRIGKCAANGCAWLFLDSSRNRSRRWCAMNDCGNREKARRHYKRKSA
jgi:predicted RNA-binding Zn ribbon-like protein